MQYMERERETLEAKHKLKLKEFDMFLSQIHTSHQRPIDLKRPAALGDRSQHIPAHNIKIMTNELLSSDPSHYHNAQAWARAPQRSPQRFQPLIESSSNNLPHMATPKTVSHD